MSILGPRQPHLCSRLEDVAPMLTAPKSMPVFSPEKTKTRTRIRIARATQRVRRTILSHTCLPCCFNKQLIHAQLHRNRLQCSCLLLAIFLFQNATSRTTSVSRAYQVVQRRNMVAVPRLTIAVAATPAPVKLLQHHAVQPTTIKESVLRERPQRHHRQTEP